jgi:hypothetical protein
MFKTIYYSIREFFENLFFGPAKCPKEVEIAIKNSEVYNPHLLTDQEYFQIFVESPTQFEKEALTFFSEQKNNFNDDPEQRACAFPIEGPKLSLSLPGPKREIIGARPCYFVV